MAVTAKTCSISSVFFLCLRISQEPLWRWNCYGSLPTIWIMNVLLKNGLKRDHLTLSKCLIISIDTVKIFYKCSLIQSWKSFQETFMTTPLKNPTFRENFLKLFIKYSCNLSCYFHVTFQEFFTKLFKKISWKVEFFWELFMNFSCNFSRNFHGNKMMLLYKKVSQNLSTKFLLCSCCLFSKISSKMLKKWQWERIEIRL